MYPPDPASMYVSTLGGNVSLNAGGPRGAKYGVTRDYVLGLEFVLPSGEVVKTGGKVLKDVSGYDLIGLMCGSEGTLGIITEIIVKLIPLPPAKATLQAIFSNLDDAAKTVSAIFSSGIVPTTLDLLDRVILDAIRHYGGAEFSKEAEALLLIEVDGEEVLVEGQGKRIEEFCKERGAILLLFGIFFMTMLGKKIERTLEIANWVMVPFMIFSVIIIGIIVVPAAHWGIAFASLVIPGAPPKGTDPALLGALAGFTAMASGLNFMYMGYYREKGYGMGHKIGYIASLVGGKQAPILTVGKTFPEDEKNAALWKRWFRYLVIDQWVVFFGGAIMGMMLPSLIVWYLAGLPDAAKPTVATMPTYAAEQLSKLMGGAGPFFFYWALIVGFLILFSTQLGVFEALVRNFTEAVYLNTRFRESILRGDPRKFYYPFMFVLLVVIAILIHIALPVDLLIISANMANLASLIFPFVLMYLISKLPRPAKAPWWSYVVLILNVIFFGFFFVNFACSRIFGVPVVTF